MLPATTRFENDEETGNLKVGYNQLVLQDKIIDPLFEAKTDFRIHSQFADAAWIQQFYEPYIELNPHDFIGRGIESDDTVEVFNDRGSFKCHVKANQAVRPGSARMYEGATADYLEEGNLQSVTNDTMIERGYELVTGPVIPFSDTLVEVKKA